MSIPHILDFCFAALFASPFVDPPSLAIISLMDIFLLSPLRENSKKSISSSSSSSIRSFIGMFCLIGPVRFGDGVLTGLGLGFDLLSIVISFRLGMAVCSGAGGAFLTSCFFLAAFIVNSDNDKPGIGLREGGDWIGDGVGNGVGRTIDGEGITDGELVTTGGPSGILGSGEFNVARRAFCSSMSLSSSAFLRSCSFTNASEDTSSRTGCGTVLEAFATEVSRISAFLSLS